MKLFVIGEPLAGKTTLVKEMSIRLGLPYLSTGDFARSMGMRREASIEKHDLSLEFDQAIRDEVKRNIRENEHVIIEGFPRSEDQFEDAELWADEKGFYLFLRIAPSLALSRLNQRDRKDTDTVEIWEGRREAAQRLYGVMRREIGYVRAAVYEAALEDNDWLYRDIKGIMHGQKNCW